MGFNKADISRTLRYLKRNGISNTWYATKERLELRRRAPYDYAAPDDAELAKQRQISPELSKSTCITLVLPAYNTPEGYFLKAVESVIAQTFSNWNLIICDASESSNDSVSRVIKTFDSDPRIHYLKLTDNKGISENTNAGIRYAIENICGGTLDRSDDPQTGVTHYIGFLDHDDLLTPDALYHMAVAIKESNPALLYSDEDKISEETGSAVYFDHHAKYDFNHDLLMTNNYVCHLMLVRSDILENIRFRSEYDGAQDYDLVLQAVRYLCKGQADGRSDTSATLSDSLSHGNACTSIDSVNPCNGRTGSSSLSSGIIHVPHVLYHWRSHAGSTATNTASKMYAYEAGLKALACHINELYCGGQGSITTESGTGTVTITFKPTTQNTESDTKPLSIRVYHSRHLGFYTVNWGSLNDLFIIRNDVGAVIGRIKDSRGRMSACIFDQDGKALYAGINMHYAGEFNRFDCAQDVYSADLSHLHVRESLKDIAATSPSSEAFAQELRTLGYLILYLPTQNSEIV